MEDPNPQRASGIQPDHPRSVTQGDALNHGVRALEDVVLLLHQAALAAWDIGDREGITSEFHYLGLGSYLAQGNAVALLPIGHLMPESWPPPTPPAETDPGRIVRSAETRLRSIPAGSFDGQAGLVLQMRDLVAEIGEHGA